MSLCLIWILYGYNWKSFLKILRNDTRERASSWECLWRYFLGLLPTESLTASTFSGHFAVNILPDLGFSAFFLRFLRSLWLKICVSSDTFAFSGDYCQTFYEFLFAILNDKSPNKRRKIFFPILSKPFWSRINSCYSILFWNLRQKRTHY